MKSLRVNEVREGFYYRERGVYIFINYRSYALEFFYSFDKEKNALTLVNAYEVPEIPRDRWARICRIAAAIGAKHKPPTEPKPIQQRLF